MNDTQTMYYD